MFNVAQIEGLPAQASTEAHQVAPEGTAQRFIATTGADIRHGGNEAAYIPSRDYIVMPPVGAFRTVEGYYATTLHEPGHWTVAEKRLNRNRTGRFGTRAYAAEELIVELTAAFLCAHLGIEGKLRHAGYL